MYWSSNIKRDEVERFGGRCRQAARIAQDKGETDAAQWLMGAWAAMDALLMMDYGEDEESFLSRVTMAFEAEAKYGGE